MRREHVLRYKLEKLEDQLDVYSKQRSHVTWLQKGDRNTDFYHSFVSDRKKKNRIKKLKNEQGGVVEKDEQMAAVITNYFHNLFSPSTGDRLEELISNVHHRVTPDMNVLLMKAYIEEEVKYALNGIGDLKAPGPDGMSAVFYKQYWHIVGEEVTREVLAVLNGAAIPERWNQTNVVLIPKVKDADCMKNLRPISLCNVVYKLVSKVVAN